MRLHDSEAEESDEDAEADASEHGNDMSNINTVASLTKGQRNYRIRIAIKYTDFRPIQTKKGPTNVLDAMCYDSTGFILFTFWGGRADSMQGALTHEDWQDKVSGLSRNGRREELHAEAQEAAQELHLREELV